MRADGGTPPSGTSVSISGSTHHCTNRFLPCFLHSPFYSPDSIVLPRGCLMMPERRYARASMAWGVRRGCGSGDHAMRRGVRGEIDRLHEWPSLDGQWTDPVSGPAGVKGKRRETLRHKVQWQWPDRGLFAAIVPVLAGASRFPPERHRCRDRCGCRRWRRCNRPDR